MFNNLGRQVVDSATTAMSRGVLKKKKKDLVRLMEKEGDNVILHLMDVARRMRETTAFEKNKAGFAVAYDYKKATHYFVSKVPSVIMLSGKEASNRLKLVNKLEDIFTIETYIGDIEILAQFVNLRKDVTCEDEVFIEGKEALWSFNVFVKFPDMSLCPVHYPLYCGYIVNDLESSFFIANDFHPFTRAFVTQSTTFTFGDTDYKVRAIKPDANKETEIVTAIYERLVDCITVIYKERSNKKAKSDEESASEIIADFLNKAISGDLDGSKKKHAVSERAISVAGEPKVEVEVEDKLVPLHRYLKEYAPSIRRAYKGGHHASPVPHDRRGYYRRSRGKGDYDLINGEFVFVGNMEGTYSWVSATHVGNKKSDSKPTLIYKV